MAELLKHQYSIDVAKNIAGMIGVVYPSFEQTKFTKEVEQGYAQLELMARGRKIALALQQFLPSDYEQALSILLKSIDAPVAIDKSNHRASFLFLPHTLFVCNYGLAHFSLSMQALYRLTQVFTAEFAIRDFIQAYPQQSLAVLANWAEDDNEHVRRLVSEGTRTRLPWASRLPIFIQDPQPVLQLLEKLKDDQSLYVRRSVANNLNDIGKDHPSLLTSTAQRWMQGASEQRQWLVKHALRSAVKRGDKAALAVLGYQQNFDLAVVNLVASPSQASLGDSLTISFTLKNHGHSSVVLMVDFAIYFVKANGQAKPKVFKLKAMHLASKQNQSLSKRVSLKPMSTRTLYPGVHKVEVIVNGQALCSTEFVLGNKQERD